MVNHLTDLAGIRGRGRLSTTNLSGVKQSDPALQPNEDKGMDGVCVFMCTHVWCPLRTYGDCVHTCCVCLSVYLSVDAHLYEGPRYDHPVDSR